MAEEYKKVGRGGAGNFYSKKDASDLSKPPSHDLESQTQTPDLTHITSASKPPPEYLHTGRGGAGNWIQPAELSAKGLEQVESADSTSSSNVGVGVAKRVLGASKPTYRGGRGGAGNYVDAAEEERARREEEERIKREMDERVTRDVEAGLIRPPKAYGGRGGAWEMGSLE